MLLWAMLHRAMLAQGHGAMVPRLYLLYLVTMEVWPIGGLHGCCSEGNGEGKGVGKGLGFGLGKGLGFGMGLGERFGLGGVKVI